MARFIHHEFLDYKRVGSLYRLNTVLYRQKGKLYRNGRPYRSTYSINLYRNIILNLQVLFLFLRSHGERIRGQESWKTASKSRSEASFYTSFSDMSDVSSVPVSR